jgi:tetratricopeptide (TPR) repeat protein
MVRVTLWALVVALGFGAAVRAADQPIYDSPPPWVRTLPIPTEGKASGAAIDILLFTSQSRLDAGVTETFVETASRINSPEGLGQLGSLTAVWDPATQGLAIHRARIIRAGKVIDLLADGRKFIVLRRETNLEAASIDGALTATLQPEGLQIGDVVDFALSRTDREPALAGHAEAVASLNHRGTIGKSFVSLTWPSRLPVHLWKTDDLPSLAPESRDGWTHVVIDQTNATTPDPPSGAMPNDQLAGIVLASDFNSWKAVSAAAYPLYETAAKLEPSSPLLAEVARIRAASPDPKAQALAALKLVESQTRYFYVGLDAGGFTPAPADKTWSRRFGDCKGKTVLLLALLRQLGIKAEPALVDVVNGDGLDRRGPRYRAFDYVIVRVEVAGQVYWLDGTRIGDESLDIMPIPDDYWALPLRAEGADLEPLRPKPPALPLREVIEQIDASAGIDKPASIQKQLILRGDAALFVSLSLSQANNVDKDKALKLMLTGDTPWIKPDTVSFTYDPLKMEGRATLKGAGVLPFTSAAGSTEVRDWDVDGGSIGSFEDFTRRSDYHRDAPYAVPYPAYNRVEVEVRLPGDGKDFEVVNNWNVDSTVGATTYIRAAAIAAGRLTMMASTRTLASTFPASDAASVQAELRNLASYDVALRYNVPSTKAAAGSDTKIPPPAVSNTPVEAARTAFAEGDYAKAEAAFTSALSVMPTAKLYYDRAAARAALGKDALAQSDLRTAIKLDPKDAFALFALGRFELRRGDLTSAATSFATAQSASPHPGAFAERIAQAYEAQGLYIQAFTYWDQAIAATPDAEARARVLNLSCWSRARAGLELDRALKDCDASLKLHPDAANVLDSRGLVQLRSGALDKALVDYDAALAQAPNTPTSLYGRALAEEKLGKQDKATADLAQARHADPGIDARFKGWGLKP